MPKIGVIGGGQLGQMLAIAGIPLGFEFVFLDPAADACASLVGTHICADYADKAALTKIVQMCDVITFEFENVTPQATEFLAQQKTAVFPPPKALQIARDRLYEKTLFNELKIPTPQFAAVNSAAELNAALDAIGTPAILKTRTLGYDGKGQFVLKNKNDAAKAWQALQGALSILEQMIAFEHEISIIAVRSQNGEIRFYPAVRNQHQNGILRLSKPDTQHPLQNLAEDYTARILQHLDYVGVLAFEFFVDENGLIANEIAPRVHNSGHWTIEGAFCSQFANHIRAITNLPLGKTKLTKTCAMLNLLGQIPPITKLLAVPNTYVHHYHKAFKAGRKVGHLTLIADDFLSLEQKIKQQEQTIKDYS